MALNNTKTGASFVPAYQSSGIPYVTQSATTEVLTNATLKHEFPYVTRFFTIQNTGAGTLRVGFTSHGVEATETANYFKIAPATTSSIRYELRCKDLFFRAESAATGFEIVAGLTTIPHDHFPVLTGSVGGSIAFKGVG